jgi:K+-sensing histidine kinase KdpD
VAPADPNDLVESALSVTAAEITESNVKLNVQLGLGLPKISVDRLQMELVVETLVKQALNQVPEGATLSVSTFIENEMFKLVMRYPVEHMSSDDLEHFFYPFTTPRLAYDTADLPVSKIIIDKHGGVIDVRVEQSNDLIVEISLPTLT